MLRLTTLISLMATMPVIAQANTVISIASSSCSGAMSISSLSGASLSCAGNLSLNGGWIDSDSSIFIRADGDLLLENLHLNAPEVSFSTITGNLQIASTVNIKAVQNDGPVRINPIPEKQFIEWESFDITLHPGSVIHFNMPGTSSSVWNRIQGDGQIVIKSGGVQITSAILNNNPITASSVPEANTSAMLLLGVGLLALRRRAA